MLLCPLRLDIDPLPDASPWLIDEGLVKKHCRISDGDEDDNLQVYVAAAILWAEDSMHRTIIRRQHRWVLREFPYDGRQEIRLPRGKTVSVDGIEYVVGGTTLELHGPSDTSPAGTDFQEDLRGDGGAVLMPPRGGSWPSVDTDVPAPITISFTAGYAADEIPQNFLKAILLGTSDSYDLRGSGDYSAAALVGNGKELAVREALVSGHRLTRWY